MELAIFTRATRFAVVAAATATLLIGTAMPSQAQKAKAKAPPAPEPTTGSVRLHIVKAGFIVGVGGGSGTLNFRGRTYHLSVSGVGIGSLGIAAADLQGTASNLTSAAAIAGSYGAAGAGGTFVGGGQVATLQNGNGVVLQLQGAQAGFQISLGLAGMNIALK